MYCVFTSLDNCKQFSLLNHLLHEKKLWLPIDGLSQSRVSCCVLVSALRCVEGGSSNASWPVQRSIDATVPFNLATFSHATSSRVLSGWLDLGDRYNTHNHQQHLIVFSNQFHKEVTISKVIWLLFLFVKRQTNRNYILNHFHTSQWIRIIHSTFHTLLLVALLGICHTAF